MPAFSLRLRCRLEGLGGFEAVRGEIAGRVRHLPFQVWRWLSKDHYEMTLYIVIDEPAGARTLRVTADYYAVPITRLLELLSEAGFTKCRRVDDLFFQPVLVAEKPLTPAV